MARGIIRRQAPRVVADTSSEDALSAFGGLLQTFGTVAGQQQAAKLQRQNEGTKLQEELLTGLQKGVQISEADKEHVLAKFGKDSLQELNIGSSAITQFMDLTRDIESGIKNGEFSGIEIPEYINEYAEKNLSESMKNKTFRSSWRNAALANTERLRKSNLENLNKDKKVLARNEFFETTSAQYETLVSNPDLTPEQVESNFKSLMNEARKTAGIHLDNNDLNELVYQMASNLNEKGVNIDPFLDSQLTRTDKTGKELKGIAFTDHRLIKLRGKKSSENKIAIAKTYDTNLTNLKENPTEVLNSGSYRDALEFNKNAITSPEKFIKYEKELKGALNKNIVSSFYTSSYFFSGNNKALQVAIGEGKDVNDAFISINPAIKNGIKDGLITEEQVRLKLDEIRKDPKGYAINLSAEEQVKIFDGVMDSQGFSSNPSLLEIDVGSSEEEKRDASSNLTIALEVMNSVGLEKVPSYFNSISNRKLTDKGFLGAFNAYKYIQSSAIESLDAFVSKDAQEKFDLYESARDIAIGNTPEEVDQSAKDIVAQALDIKQSTGTKNLASAFVQRPDVGGYTNAAEVVRDEILGEPGKGDLDVSTDTFFDREFKTDNGVIQTMTDEILESVSLQSIVNPSLTFGELVQKEIPKFKQRSFVISDTSLIITLPSKMRDDDSKNFIDKGSNIIFTQFENALEEFEDNPEKFGINQSDTILQVLKEKESFFGQIDEFDISTTDRTKAANVYSIDFKSDTNDSMKKLWAIPLFKEEMEKLGIKDEYTIAEFRKLGSDEDQKVEKNIKQRTELAVDMFELLTSDKDMRKLNRKKLGFTNKIDDLLELKKTESKGK
jgi:hypothetical protein